MKPRLVQYLACPDCGGDIVLEAERREGEEIVEGTLRCDVCRGRFPIERGVPRLLPRGVAEVSVEVAEGFGWEWNEFDELRGEYQQQFLDWIHPLAPEDFAGRLVVEGGCGKGRHTKLVAELGAREVFAVDLGTAVEAAQRNAGQLPNVHIIQGDLTHLPLKPVAEVAFSVGVLHHLPDPAVGFRSLVDHLVPGGRIAVWVYGYEGNEWIVKLVDPVRKRVTSRLPRPVLYELSRPLGWLVTASSHGLYGPLASLSPALHRLLPYRDYLTYIARLPAREIHTIVFDQLVTPVSHYLRRQEVEAWFVDRRLAGVEISQHNGNSWRASARRVDLSKN